MIDQKPFQQVQETTSEVVNSLHKTSQAVADSVISMQNHNLRFAQNLFLSWMELLTHQTESIQQVQQQWGSQIQKQQGAFQKMMPPSMRIYIDFLLAPLTLSRKLVETSMTGMQRERERVPSARFPAPEARREPVGSLTESGQPQS